MLYNFSIAENQAVGRKAEKLRKNGVWKGGVRISFSNTKFFGELLIYIGLYDIIGKLHIIDKTTICCVYFRINTQDIVIHTKGGT